MITTLADLVDTPSGNRYLIPWKWLTSNAKKTMEIVFQFAFDEEQDFTRGFAIHHLRYVDLVDVKAIKYLDFKHVQLAIEEIQRIALNKKYPDLPTIDNEEKFLDSFQLNTFEVYDDLIRKASNIEDLTEAIINRLDAEFPMSERDKAVVYARAGWLTSSPQTLDSIGRDYGLTRERIRQIAKKYETPELRIQGEIRFGKLLSKVANEADSLNDFQKKAISAFLTSEEYLDIGQCQALMALFPESKDWTGFHDQMVNWDGQAEVYDQAVGQVSKFRSKMGFIDVTFAANEMKLTREKTIEVIIQKYPRSIIGGNLVLARTESIVSTFESSIYKQLLVFDNLPAIEILEGSQRHGAVRKDAMSGNEFDYIDVIHQLSGNPPSLDIFRQNQLYETELGESDKWFINIFNSSPSGLLHRVEITKLAIDARINLGSITAYCASTSFLRLHSNGVYSLVGKYVSKSEISTHAELALAQESPVSFQLDFNGSNVVLTLKPNLNTYASGVLLPNREIKELFTDSVFSPDCLCGPIDSKQLVKLSNDGFWTGFQSFFAHGLNTHRYTTNSTFEIFFDFDLKKATLRPQT